MTSTRADNHGLQYIDWAAQVLYFIFIDHEVSGKSTSHIVFSLSLFIILSFLVLVLIRCPFHHRVTAVARRRPWSFCQKCSLQVTPKYSNTLDPMKSEWADYAAVQAECGNLYGNEFTGDLSGNIQQQSSQFAEPLWTDPGIKGGINGGE